MQRILNSLNKKTFLKENAIRREICVGTSTCQSSEKNPMVMSEKRQNKKQINQCLFLKECVSVLNILKLLYSDQSKPE